MKIANMLTGKIFISSEQLEEFQSNFRNDVTYGNIKTHKKTGFSTLSLEDTFLEKLQEVLG